MNKFMIKDSNYNFYAVMQKNGKWKIFSSSHFNYFRHNLNFGIVADTREEAKDIMEAMPVELRPQIAAFAKKLRA